MRGMNETMLSKQRGFDLGHSTFAKKLYKGVFKRLLEYGGCIHLGIHDLNESGRRVTGIYVS
jgi:hypothetical protein